MTQDEMVEAMARGILEKVPAGYGMTDVEAAGYARAALTAIQADYVLMPRVLDDATFDAMCGANDWNDGGLVLPNNVRKIHAALVAHIEGAKS